MPQAKPVCEFDRDQRAAFALSATIPLPCPFPASGRISLGIMPRPNDDVDDRYYIKIVEDVGDQQRVTRLVALEDVRGIRLRPSDDEYAPLKDWTLLTAEDFQVPIQEVKDRLKLAADGNGRAFEIPLFTAANNTDPQLQGIVYVPETAPTLVRTEYAVSAAEAAEHPRSLARGSGGAGCCLHSIFHPERP